MMYDRTGLVYPMSNYTKISLLPGQNYRYTGFTPEISFAYQCISYLKPVLIEFLKIIGVQNQLSLSFVTRYYRLEILPSHLQIFNL